MSTAREMGLRQVVTTEEFAAGHGVANQAGVTISDYGRGSDFGREMSSALRQIEEAASSIDRLAKQIARNPNSLITGR